LSEKEVLALAISLEEDDARIYVDYAERLKADFSEHREIAHNHAARRTAACPKTHR
jgi:erythrin-vacuolar iron transport family protein